MHYAERAEQRLVFGNYFGVLFASLPFIDITDNITMSNVLAVNDTVTYIRYIRVSKVTVKHKEMLWFLVQLDGVLLAAKTPYVTNLDVSVLYIL